MKRKEFDMYKFNIRQTFNKYQQDKIKEENSNTAYFVVTFLIVVLLYVLMV